MEWHGHAMWETKPRRDLKHGARHTRSRTGRPNSCCCCLVAITLSRMPAALVAPPARGGRRMV